MITARMCSLKEIPSGTAATDEAARASRTESVRVIVMGIPARSGDS